MLIFLYGPDTFRRDQKLKEIVAEYERKHTGLARRHCDLGEENALAILAAAAAPSLFDSVTLLVIHGLVSIAKDGEKELARILHGFINAANVVAVILADGKPTKGLAFLLEKPARSQEFPLLFGRPLEDFIKFMAGQIGARLTPTELKRLGDVYAGDSWGLVTELSVLVLRGASGRDPVARSQPAADLYQQLLSWPRLRGGAKLAFLERLLGGDDAAKIFNLLAYQSSLAEKEKMAAYDVAIKTGKLDYELALTELATSD